MREKPKFERIEPERFYTASDVIRLGELGLFPIKSRTTLHKLIHEGRISPVNVGRGKTLPIYAFQGKLLLAYLDSNVIGLSLHKDQRGGLQVVRTPSIGSAPLISEEHSSGTDQQPREPDLAMPDVPQQGNE